MADQDDDNQNEDFHGEFESLVADLNNMHQWRAEKAAEEAAAVAEQARRDRLAAQAAAARTSDAALRRKARQMAAHEVAAMAEYEHRQRSAEARMQHARRQRIEDHRDWLRQEIPDVLQKALQVQQRGGCTALDVARVTSECHRLAERWGL